MTRKDYIKLAEVFAVTRPNFERTANYDSRIVQWTVDRACIADALELENPRFDREKWYKATEANNVAS